MLLILTNSQDATADYLASRLTARGIRFLRFDTDTTPSHSRVVYLDGECELLINGTPYHHEDFSNLWYRRPEHLKLPQCTDDPESRFVLDEWAEALEAFFAHIPKAKWVNHPAANVGASHKPQQLTVAKSLGFRVPNTLITQDPSQLRDFFQSHKGRIISKPLSGGRVERPEGQLDSLIYTSRVHVDHLDSLEDLPSCPTLFQEFITKAVDVRVTVLDDDIHAVELIAKEPDGSQRCDIRRNNMDDVTYGKAEIPSTIVGHISSLMAYYDLRFAAIDLVVSTNGDWYFLEVNPNGQWAWLDLVGATKIADSFVKVFADEHRTKADRKTTATSRPATATRAKYT